MSADDKADAAWNDYVSQQQEEKIEELERQLNAANERIKQLEAVVNDPEVLWSNWLRGTVKLPSGIGDVRQYQDRIKRLEEAGDKMAELIDGGVFMKYAVQWYEAKESKP